MVAGREQVRAADGERTTRSDAAADWLLEEARERVFDAHKRAVGAPLTLAPNLSQPYISLSEPNTDPRICNEIRSSKYSCRLCFKRRSFFVFVLQVMFHVKF